MTHTPWPRSAALLAMLLFAGVSCGDTSGPDELSGTYALTSLWGASGPPFVISEITCPDGSSRIREVLHDSLTFTGNNSVRRSASERQRNFDPDGSESAGPAHGFSRTGTVTREGALLTFTYPGAPEIGVPELVDELMIEGPTLTRSFPVSLFDECGDSTDYRGGKYEYTRQ